MDSPSMVLGALKVPSLALTKEVGDFLGKHFPNQHDTDLTKI